MFQLIPGIQKDETVVDGHLKDQFAALKDIASNVTDKGMFTSSTARQHLKRKPAQRIGDQQEVRIPTRILPSRRRVTASRK